MLNRGISLERTWRYMSQEHTNAAMANPETVIPWHAGASAGLVFGKALGNANSMAQHNMASSGTL